MKRRLLQEQDGFTLVEVLVTMVMMLTVMFALYSIFDMSLRVFSYGNDKIEAVENARLGLTKMEREIRAAYPYDKAAQPPNTPDEKLFARTDANEITFGNDRNGDREITVPEEEITYRLSVSGPSYTLLRVNPSDGSGDPAVEYVKADGLKFEYLDRFGNTASSEPDIKKVRITLDIEVEDGSQALTTDVSLRNREG